MELAHHYSIRAENKDLNLKIHGEKHGFRLDLHSNAGLDEVGIFFRLCAAFRVHGCHVNEAHLSTDGEGRIMDHFRVEVLQEPSEAELERLISDIRGLLFDELSLREYLRCYDEMTPGTASDRMAMAVLADHRPGGYLLRIYARRSKDVVFRLARALYLMDIDICQARLRTDASGRFFMRLAISALDKRFLGNEFRKRLCDELKSVL